jgi:hypothetical protein
MICSHSHSRCASQYPLGVAQKSKVEFWHSKDLYGLDVSVLTPEALADHFAVTIVGVFSPSLLVAATPSHQFVDFMTATLDSVSTLRLNFSVVADRAGV